MGTRLRAVLPQLVQVMLLAASGAVLAETRTTADGVYTSKQAARGLAVHEKYCAKCHHSSYFQGGFMVAWQHAPVSTLYDLIVLKMPEDRPGALKPREYAALLAWIFELNGLPAGDGPLSHDQEDMAAITIAPAE